MRVWLSSQNIHPSMTHLPPMYAWPPAVKRIVLLLAVGACLGIYLLLIASLLGISLLWFS